MYTRVHFINTWIYFSFLYKIDDTFAYGTAMYIIVLYDIIQFEM